MWDLASEEMHVYSRELTRIAMVCGFCALLWQFRLKGGDHMRLTEMVSCSG